MVIEVLTFVSLLAVLLIRYATSTHMSSLRSEQNDLALEHRRLRGRKGLIQDRIAEAEAKEHDLQNLIRTLEHQLDELQRELMEKETRNNELREQIDVTF